MRGRKGPVDIAIGGGVYRKIACKIPERARKVIRAKGRLVMLAEDVLVALGQDDIADAYYPFGRNNLLEVGFLGVHMLWMTTFPEMERIYDMITVDAARAMNIPRFVIRAGSPAHCVVLNAENVYEALWKHEEPSQVISHGKLVDRAGLPE